MELLRQLWPMLSGALLLAAGVFGDRLWQRYLNRLALFRWSSWHSNAATAGYDPNLGKIEVIYNGQPVTNLQFCNIDLENESSRDFTNVHIELWYDDGTQIYSQGNLFGSSRFLPYAPRYDAMLAKMAATPEANRRQEDIDFVLSRRAFVIPVFNRGARITMTFMVHPPHQGIGLVRMVCEHPGVRLAERPQRSMIWGVVRSHADTWGVVVGIATVILSAWFIEQRWLALSVVLAVGLAGEAIGAGLIRLWQLLWKLVG